MHQHGDCRGRPEAGDAREDVAVTRAVVEALELSLTDEAVAGRTSAPREDRSGLHEADVALADVRDVEVEVVARLDGNDGAEGARQHQVTRAQRTAELAQGVR